jgi:hypothetical protein
MYYIRYDFCTQMPLSITFVALARPFFRLLPRADAEELQLLFPWIPAPSFSCTFFFIQLQVDLHLGWYWPYTDWYWPWWDGIDRLTLQVAWLPWQERHASKNISPPGRRRVLAHSCMARWGILHQDFMALERQSRTDLHAQGDKWHLCIQL